MSFTKDTKALCVFCNKIVPAKIIEVSGRLYLKKFCSTDGVHAVKLLNNADFFINLYNFREKLHVKLKKQTTFSLVSSGKCNMSCPVCYFDWYKDKTEDISIQKLEELIRDNKDYFILYGSETLCYSNADQLLYLFKEHKKEIPTLITNGIVFSDLQYANKLKQLGLKNVLFQFDGCNAEANKVLRGADYTDIKLGALSNLHKQKINISLYSLVKKYTNESEIKNIFELALKNKYIKEITFLAYIEFDTSKRTSIEYESKTLLFDELIEISLKQLGLGSFGKFLKFQKIFLFFLSLRNEKGCLSNAHYFTVVANNNKYIPDDFMDTDSIINSMEKYLSTGSWLFLRRQRFCKAIFLGCLLVKKLRYKKLKKIILPMCLGKIKFLKMKFAKCCGPYDFYTEKMKTCGTGVIFSAGGKIYKKDKFSISPYYKLKKESQS